MTLNSKTYWNDRVNKFGHTGWSDFATYYYDQNLRLNAVEKIIVDNDLEDPVALDYGCGTGDFSKILSKYCDKVIATDISDKVIDRAKSINTNFRIEYHELGNNIFGYKYDLILSITVLQHILDNDKLAELVGKFESSLSQHGIIIIFESFSNNEANSDYQKLRKVEDFVRTFQDAGLTLKSLFDFYHPSNLPTELFNKYRKNVIIKILNRLCSLRVPGVNYLLRQIAHYLSNKDNGIIEKDSITKILVFGKQIRIMVIGLLCFAQHTSCNIM
jgi:2-polyprenyl-3-methyl-5-hydroxy-6-metoxy-1,4-benzoquinol methylase